MAKGKQEPNIMERLSSAEREQAEKILAGMHARLRLWGKCRGRVCRRRRRCTHDVEACGTRTAPQHWKWLHHFLTALHEGNAARAAVRAADERIRPKYKRIRDPDPKRGPTVFVINDDGSCTNVVIAPPPFRFDKDLKRAAAAMVLHDAGRDADARRTNPK
jgi:hypothetical protein